jgi:PAS domain S-box-containing protein
MGAMADLDANIDATPRQVAPGSVDSISVQPGGHFEANVFDAVLQHCSEAAFTVDRESGRIVTANEKLIELTGRSRDWLLGSDVTDLIVGADQPAYTSVLDRPGLHEEVPMCGIDGYPVYVALTVAFVEDPAVGALAACIARDTTERKLIERELIAKHTALHAAHAELARVLLDANQTNEELAQRNKELGLLTAQLCEADRRVLIGELSAGLAHSLNNPLGAVVSAHRQLQRLINELGGEELVTRSARLLRRSMEALGRTEEIIQTIRRAHRAGNTATESTRLSLGREIDAALALFEDRLGNYRVERSIPNDDAVFAPAGDVQHILWNLMDNALLAMPDGGTLDLSVEPTPQGARLSIQDTGPGLPASIAHRLFDPFVTTRSTGTGLGLYVAKRLSEQWGGDLRHVPTDVGARFELVFTRNEE